MGREVRLTVGRSDRASRSLWPYVGMWALLGTVGLVVIAGLAGDGLAQASAPRLLLLTILTAIGEWVSLDLRSRDSGVSLSLLEAAIVADLLLLPPLAAALAVTAGVLIRHVLRRTPAMKLVFNVGQHAVSASLAAGIFLVVPDDPLISLPRVLAAALSVLLARGVNTLALTGIFRRLGESALVEQLTKRPLELAATTIGNASIGVIACALWTAYPWLVWVVAAPALTLFLAYGSSYQIENLLTDVKAERDRLTRVIGGVQEGIVLLDRDATVLMWSPAMVTITGLDAEDVEGRPVREVLVGTDPDGLPIDAVTALRPDAPPTSVQTADLELPDGSSVAVRMVHTLLHDDEGQCAGDVLVVHDLTREREAASLKEDFVARVSHELRTPLSPVRGYAQVLLRAGDRIDAAKRNEALAAMVERIDHMEHLIDDLLLVSRIAAGRIDPASEVKPVDVDVHELVGRLITWLDDHHTDGRDIHVTNLANGSPTAWADSLRTGQIVTNLLTNACKYGAPNTPVEVEVDRGDGTVLVRVRDHGPGIPEDKLEAVFERFQRLEDPQRMRTRGLGLGLYISRHLADAMGGSLVASSRRGVGSTFTLTLPAARPEDEPDRSGRRDAAVVAA